MTQQKDHAEHHQSDPLEPQDSDSAESTSP